MPSKWIEHIRDFAKRNNLTYGCALSDPKCSEEYRNKFQKPVEEEIIPVKRKKETIEIIPVKRKKSKKEELFPLEEEIIPVKRKKIKKKLDLSKTDIVPLEEAIPDTEPKTKMIVATKPKVNPVDIITGPDFYLKLPFTEDYYLNPRTLVSFDNEKPYINNVLYGNISIGRNLVDGKFDKDMAKIEANKLKEQYPPYNLEKSLIELAKEFKKVFPRLIETKKLSMKSGFVRQYAIKKVVENKPAPAAVRDWVFKADKKATPVERAYLLNALPNDRKIAEEGLYKNDRAEDFTVRDFKDAIDKNKKPETSVLLRIAKYLQKNKFGKIVYSKVGVSGRGIQLNRDMVMKMVGEGMKC
jgi:hypothetical protein